VSLSGSLIGATFTSSFIGVCVLVTEYCSLLLSLPPPPVLSLLGDDAADLDAAVFDE